MSAKNPLFEFTPETTAMYAEPIPQPAPFPMTPPPRHAIDTTSRVISFVLGFALASLIAWVGSISGDDVAATGNSDPVAAVGTPVVAATLEEKKMATSTRPATTQPGMEATGAPGPARPRAAVSAATAAPAPTIRPVSAPPRTAQPSSSGSTAARPAAGGYRGALVLNSTPEGAQVILNGKVVGSTPVVLNNLPIGSRALLVRREGYSPWSTSIRIVANQRTTVRATLVPAPQDGG